MKEALQFYIPLTWIFLYSHFNKDKIFGVHDNNVLSIYNSVMRWSAYMDKINLSMLNVYN